MRRITFCFILFLLFPAFVFAQNDEEYAAKIKEFTTDAKFLNEMVDHLPQSYVVPSPLQHFGSIIGAPGILHYTDEIYGYLRAVANASDRVVVESIGKTEENREMINVIIGDASTIADLETYRTYLNQLADPRIITDDQAKMIVTNAKPIYFFTGGLHSPETGSPEMLMELAYRLAVEDSPMINAIRENVIVMFVPVAEPDGRDRMVDIYNYRKAHNDVGPGLMYWGHYVAHDNNRDGFGLGLALTRNILKFYLHWKPQIFHDLHESVPYLYVSTGTGPYNEYIDPITIAEWHNLSHEEVTELTRRGMPGVWTHGFYTGWAANYLMWISNIRNATGRFYETFGNSIPETKERKLQSRRTSKKWYRPNPPLEKAMWWLRNNTNYMQSGVLVGLNYVAKNKQRFLENFYTKSKNSVNRGKEEAPYAFVIPKSQRRPLATAKFVNLLRQQGLEIHVADEKLEWKAKKKKKKKKENTDKDQKKKEKAKPKTAEKGSYIVRLDQPYRTLALVLLGKQNFPKDAKPPYDDTGWTLPYLWHVEAHRVDDEIILSNKMTMLNEPIEVKGKVENKGRKIFLVNNTTDDNVTVFRLSLKDIQMFAAEEPFKAGKHDFNSGTIIIKTENNPADVTDQIEEAAENLGLVVRGVSKMPDVKTHELEVAKIALVHTWVSTPQSAGWWRLAFEKIGIPYTYLSEQDLGAMDLSQFNVIIMPHTRASTNVLVSGNSMVGEPLPWKNSPEYKHIGIIDETDDIRKGMGDQGVSNLREFINNGGVFITEASTSSFPIDVGITRRISIQRTKNLLARGTVLRATATKFKSPIMYGYPDTVAVYFSQSPVFQIRKDLSSYRLPDWYKDEAWYSEVPQPVLNFAKKNILMSGMLRGESEIAGKPAIVDVPVGKGHVILFANHPFWRWETHGSHAFVFNTILNWNDLHVGWPERPQEDEEDVPVAPAPGHEWHQLEKEW